MPINQFADVSKNLTVQIKVIEDLLKRNLFIEANALMSKVTKSYRTLESLMAEDNKIQKHIAENRQREIAWIHNDIQDSLKKKGSKSIIKRKARIIQK